MSIDPAARWAPLNMGKAVGPLGGELANRTNLAAAGCVGNHRRLTVIGIVNGISNGR